MFTPLDNGSISNYIAAMKYQYIFRYASRLREKGNAYLLAELKKAGLQSLSPSHGDMLAYLFKYKVCTMSDLAKFVRRSKSTLTVLADKLEKSGYIKRWPNPEDSRSTLVGLTEKGLALQPIFETISQGLTNLVAEKLTNAEAETLEKLLGKCIE